MSKRTDSQKPETRTVSPPTAQFLIGAIATFAQVVLMREALIITSGNELAMALALGLWLFWSGLGAWIGTKRPDPADSWWTPLLIKIVGFAPLVSVMLVRFIPLVISLPKGAVMGLGTSFFPLFLALAPAPFMVGFSFALNSRITDPVDIASPGRLYRFETTGCAFGGLLSLLYPLIGWEPLPTLLILPAVLLLFIPNAPEGDMRAYKRILGAVVAWGGTVLWIVLVTLGLDPDLHQRCLGFPVDEQVQFARETPWGHLLITGKSGQTNVYRNRRADFSIPDKLRAEEITHIPILEHPNPKKILLIGGGLAGNLEQALTYKDLRIDYQETDRILLAEGIDPFPDEVKSLLKAPNVRYEGREARLGLMGEGYDVIVLDRPAPATALTNRFYTKEFFAGVKRAMTPNGVFAFRLPADENFIGRGMARMLRSYWKTLNVVFPDVVVLPGMNALFIASNQKGILTKDPEILIRRARERSAAPTIIISGMLTNRLSDSHFKTLDNALNDESIQVAINEDLRPVGFVYTSAFQLSRYRGDRGLSRILGWTAENATAVSISFTAFFILAGALFLLKKSRRTERIPVCSILLLGFSGLALEIWTLLLVQVRFGNLYLLIGLFVALFMTGLACGVWIAERRAIKSPVKSLMRIHLGMGLLTVLAILVLPSVNFAAIIAMATALNFLAGMLLGVQYPVALSVFASEEADIGKWAGLLFSLDLFGAAAAGILVSALLVPTMGFQTPAAILLILNLSFFLFLSRE